MHNNPRHHSVTRLHAWTRRVRPGHHRTLTTTAVIMPAPPSDYEQRRQQKIAHNHALLQQLQLAAHHTALAPSTPASAPAARPHKRRRPADKPATPPASAPRRSSARLQGIVADSDAARQKDELDAVDAATQRDSLRAKRQRVAGDIHLGDAVVNGRAWERAGEWLADVAGGPSRDEEDPARKGELGALRESLAALRLWDGAPPNAIRITPERVYSAAFHPTPEKPLVFAGGSRVHRPGRRAGEAWLTRCRGQTRQSRPVRCVAGDEHARGRRRRRR